MLAAAGVEGRSTPAVEGAVLFSSSDEGFRASAVEPLEASKEYRRRPPSAGALAQALAQAKQRQPRARFSATQDSSSADPRHQHIFIYMHVLTEKCVGE
jgi:hypothetical protein